MGAIADAIVAYAQPLIDQTDGSHEQLQEALSISQMCYNLALFSEDERNRVLDETQQSLEMDDAEFADFRQSVIEPMIERHRMMFPLMHQGPNFMGRPTSTIPTVAPTSRTSPVEKYPGTDRYAPCPCGSGEKYKFCCGSKRR